jgi:hypothetical protein
MKWQDVPPTDRSHNGRPIKWQKEAAELRANPKRWALLTTAVSRPRAAQTALRIRNGVSRAFGPAGTFEAAARGCDVYARYVGDPDE